MGGILSELYIYQIITLYTLNILQFYGQLYLNKTVKKYKKYKVLVHLGGMGDSRSRAGKEQDEPGMSY